jgi:hypothetical protein
MDCPVKSGDHRTVDKFRFKKGLTFGGLVVISAAPGTTSGLLALDGIRK